MLELLLKAGVDPGILKMGCEEKWTQLQFQLLGS
jgi:hypothetical protein